MDAPPQDPNSVPQETPAPPPMAAGGPAFPMQPPKKENNILKWVLIGCGGFVLLGLLGLGAVGYMGYKFAKSPEARAIACMSVLAVTVDYGKDFKRAKGHFPKDGKELQAGNKEFTPVILDKACATWSLGASPDGKDFIVKGAPHSDTPTNCKFEYSTLKPVVVDASCPKAAQGLKIP